MSEGTRSDDAETARADGDPDEVRRLVRERYAETATEADACCGDAATAEAGTSACCGDGGTGSERLGYDESDLAAVAAGADLGLGCGNPKALADLSSGETVLDLGSGAGFDCFLAAREVGPEGRVVGVDMTPEMVSKARENVERNDASNVEFRLGEIEHLPVADGVVDVVVSNCVVNLSPEKPQVFDEAFRVLRPGGRLAVSDVVRTAPLPDDVRADPASRASCVSGAATVDALATMLDDAGFERVAIAPKAESESFVREWDDERDPSEYLVSATIEAEKPVDGG